MSPTQYESNFDRDGFTVIREFLDADVLAELKSQLDRYIREVVPRLPESSCFYLDKSRPETLKQLHNMDADSYFAALAESATWKSLATTLVGEEVTADPPEWFNQAAQLAKPNAAASGQLLFQPSPAECRDDLARARPRR